MAGEAMGHKSYAQWALEATYGTGVAATRRAGIISHTLEQSAGVILDPTLDDSVSRQTIIAGRQTTRGTVTTTIDYETYGLWWDCLFGTATYGSVGATTTGTSSPFTHSLIERSVLNSMTVQLIEGNIPTGKCSQVLGLKVYGATLRFQEAEGEQGIGTVVWDVSAKDMVEDATPTGSLTAPSAKRCVYTEIAQSTSDDGTGDGAAIRWRNLTLSIRNPVEEEGALGQSTIEEPIRNNFLEISFSSQRLYKTKSGQARLRSGATASPKVVIGSAATKRITFDMPTARITRNTKPIGGYGPILETNEVLPSKDAGNSSACKLTFENTVAAGTFF